MQVKRILGDDNKIEVNLTDEGFRFYRNLSPLAMGRMIFESGNLHPGDMFKVNNTYGDIKTLNRYYDLSETGEYELTFYTRDFLADDDHQIGKYPGPCTVRFKIEGNTNWLDSHVVWPEEPTNRLLQ